MSVPDVRLLNTITGEITTKRQKNKETEELITKLKY